MRLEDYEAVYALWLSCPGMGLNNLDDSKEGIEQYLTRNPETCFVAVEGDEVVGAILSGHDGRRGHIGHTAVRQEYRRQGIGKKLVEAALESLKKQNIRKVSLVVFARNDAGNAFWEKMGFAKREDLAYRDYALASDMIRMDT